MGLPDDKSGKSKSWMKAALVAVGCLFAYVFANALGGMFGRATVDQFSSGYSAVSQDAALRQGIQEAAIQIRQQVPIQVDEDTKLIDVISIGNRINYIMAINFELDSSKINYAKSFISEQNSSKVCSDENTRRLIDAGGVMAWTYNDIAGNAFAVEVSECL